MIGVADERYNNVQLDGKPMKTDLIGTNVSSSAAVLPSAGAFGDSNVAPCSGHGRDNYGRSRGGGRDRGFGRSHGRGMGHGEKISAEDLDADLEKYHANTMQTN